MRVFRNILLASTALAVAGPAAAQDRSCESEAEAFIETVLDSDQFDEIESEFESRIAMLREAAAGGEDVCYSFLISTQLALVDAGVEIDDASDADTVERYAELAEGAGVNRTTVEVEAVPAQVGIVEREATVAVEQDATEVDVAQRPSEIEVTQPGAEINVAAPRQNVEVTQPDAQISVEGAAPQVAVTQPAPTITIEQAEPAIAIEQSQPEVTIEQPEPEIIVRQFQPEVEIRQPQPRITVEQPEPQVSVVQPEPIIRVEAAEPEVQVSRAEPQVTVEQATPEVNVTQREPEVEVRQPDAVVSIDEQEPEVSVQQGESDVSITQADPVVDVSQGEAEIDISQGSAEVAVAQGEPQVSTDIASGALVDASREGDEPDVEVTRDDEPEVVRQEEETRDYASVDAAMSREIAFAFDSAEVSADDHDELLEEIIDMVGENDDHIVVLTGYASPIGDPACNLDLSERRVEAVEAILVERGLDEDRIRRESSGIGASEVDRLVEIRVIDESEITG